MIITSERDILEDPVRSFLFEIGLFAKKGQILCKNHQ
jgi:hypothetical protein